MPAPILAITIKRGGILIGAFDGDRMVAFVYSIPGLKNGKPMHWSHMLGVVDEYRNAGLGRELKLLQRERALALGIDLIEWTYDPMQATNAHLNFARLGGILKIWLRTFPSSKKKSKRTRRASFRGTSSCTMIR